MSLEEFAMKELKEAGLFDKDSDYGGLLGESVMRLIRCFAAEGHSGMSAGIARDIFHRLSAYEPINPLTGHDDEWERHYEDCWQNKRCGAVFKDGPRGRPYYIDGRVFRDRDGCGFTSYGSRVPLKFPCFVPETRYYSARWAWLFRLWNHLTGI